MSTKRPDVDSKCFDLALLFLNEVEGMTDDDCWALAKDIQTACEDACRAVEERTTYDVTLDRLEISVRASNCLKLADAKTVGEVRAMSDGQLLRLPNFGRKSLKEVRDAIENKQWCEP
jgi:DNA-directed RNA polymerase alpha subunit